MRRVQKEICRFCGNAAVDGGAPFCSDCGHPTLSATHAERVEWEVRQWRNRARTGSSSAEVPQAAQASKQAGAEPNGRGGGGVATLDRVKPQTDDDRTRSSFGSLIKRFLRWVREAFGTPVWSDAVSVSEAAAIPLSSAPTPTMPAPGSPEPPAPAPVETNEPMPVVEAPTPLNAARAEEDAARPVSPSPPKASDLRLAARAALTTKPPVAEPAPVATEEVPAPQAALVESVPQRAGDEPPPSARMIEDTSNGKKVTRKARPARKRPKVPTNKEMLKRTLSVVTRVERRLLHLEEEFAGNESDRRSRAAGNGSSSGTSSAPEPDGTGESPVQPQETPPVTWIGPVRIDPADRSDR